MHVENTFDPTQLRLEHKYYQRLLYIDTQTIPNTTVYNYLQSTIYLSCSMVDYFGTMYLSCSENTCNIIYIVD